MKQKKMLALTLSQLEQLYRHELPELVSIAVQSDDAEAFKANLTEYIAGHPVPAKYLHSYHTAYCVHIRGICCRHRF